MEVEQEIKQLKEQQERAVVPVCCCSLAGRAGRRFWGVVLFVVGTVLLLGSLGLAADLLWSLLLIVFGIYLLLWQSQESSAS